MSYINEKSKMQNNINNVFYHLCKKHACVCVCACTHVHSFAYT